MEESVTKGTKIKGFESASSMASFRVLSPHPQPSTHSLSPHCLFGFVTLFLLCPSITEAFYGSHCTWKVPECPWLPMVPTAVRKCPIDSPLPAWSRSPPGLFMPFSDHLKAQNSFWQLAFFTHHQLEPESLTFLKTHLKYHI